MVKSRPLRTSIVLAFMAGLPLRPLPALAQGVESKAAAERIVGSPVTEEQASSAADAAKVAAAIDNTGAAIEAVRKASKLDRVDIVFLPDAAATEGGPAPALDRKVKEHAGELSTLRDELAGNAMLYHAINSRRILPRDVLAVEFPGPNRVTIYAAAKPADRNAAH